MTTTNDNTTDRVPKALWHYLGTGGRACFHRCERWDAHHVWVRRSCTDPSAPAVKVSRSGLDAHGHVLVPIVARDGRAAKVSLYAPPRPAVGRAVWHRTKDAQTCVHVVELDGAHVRFLKCDGTGRAQKIPVEALAKNAATARVCGIDEPVYDAVAWVEGPKSEAPPAPAPAPSGARQTRADKERARAQDAEARWAEEWQRQYGDAQARWAKLNDDMAKAAEANRRTLEGLNKLFADLHEAEERKRARNAALHTMRTNTFRVAAALVELDVRLHPDPQRFLTVDALKQAWRKAAFDTHPDRGGDPAKFKAAKDAYEFLRPIAEGLA